MFDRLFAAFALLYFAQGIAPCSGAEIAKPTHIPYALAFDYPLGDLGYDTATGTRRPLQEQIDHDPADTDSDGETNDLYAYLTGDANPQSGLNQIRAYEETIAAEKVGWYLSQDTGNYFDGGKGLHPGEDWNRSDEGGDVGAEVRAIATGQLCLIKETESGYLLVIRHWLPSPTPATDGGTIVDSIYQHVAPTKRADGSSNIGSASGGYLDTGAAFPFAEGDLVYKGELIAVISRAVPHLHLEIRIKPVGEDVLPNDNSLGYYGAGKMAAGQHPTGMSLEQVEAAYDNMRLDGIVDPSDFIDAHREITPSNGDRIFSRYCLVDLGVLPLTNKSYAVALNNQAQVVGFCRAGSNRTSHGFLWDPGSGMQNLATGTIASNVTPTDVNDAGEVVGWHGVATSADAFSWSESGGFIDHGDLPGTGRDYTQFLSLNDSGAVVGDSYQPGSTSPANLGGLLWSDGNGDGAVEAAEITTLDAIVNDAACTDTAALLINNAGQIVGRCQDDVPFIWTPGGSVQRLEPDGADEFVAEALNELGWVGGALKGESPGERGALWRPGLGYHEIPNTYRIDALNANGLAIGMGDNSGFIWSETQGTQDLASLLDESADGWTFRSVDDINDHGVIAASMWNLDGQLRAVLLVPHAQVWGRPIALSPEEEAGIDALTISKPTIDGDGRPCFQVDNPDTGVRCVIETSTDGKSWFQAVELDLESKRYEFLYLGDLFDDLLFRAVIFDD